MALRLGFAWPLAPIALVSLLLGSSSGAMVSSGGSTTLQFFPRSRASVPTLQAFPQLQPIQVVPIEIQILQQQLTAVRNLPRLYKHAKTAVECTEFECTESFDPLLDDGVREPSFRQLFTHETWARYTGRPCQRRWFTTIRTWPFSTVCRSIVPCVSIVSLWSFVVSFALGHITRITMPPNMWIPLSLQGTAIGLLLVFRTNNSYLRLAEAREQWGRLLMLAREIASTVSCEAASHQVTCDVCRYLCAFTWSLRDKLRDDDMRDDILLTLLSPTDAEWVVTQRSRPLAILSLLRRLIHSEHRSGRLDSQVFYFIETDVKEVDTVVESCERLFSSPIPPNMARHGMRSVTLWILALPIVLTSSMAPALVALWTASTAYIYLGVDELGAQVEQPFKILPLWQLCHLAQLNVEEALSTPEVPLRLNQKTMATPEPLSCQSGNPFGSGIEGA